jgi:RimJ/RimL family protein N-acetyltransferase
MTVSEIRAVPLQAAGIALEPLTEAHRAGLAEAGADPAVWRYLPYNAAPGVPGGLDRWFDMSLELQETHKEAIWAVRGRDGAIVGSTRYLNIAAHDLRVEIGGTWYAPSVWAGVVNPACKFMLLSHGFETLGFNRIELKTDARNTRSQAAIAKLGATREGVFRRHMVLPDGHIRDTVYFSIIREEWPQVKARLQERLASFGAPCETTPV